MDIYCVKIRQVQGKANTYFPFERLYIVPDEFITSDQWRDVFPYMLVVESPESVLIYLRGMGLKTSKKISLSRGPEEISTREYSPTFGKFLPDMTGKKIVIPTYKHKTKIGYLWSYLKKAKAVGLELSLYTPERVVPSICYSCLNLSHKYSGECHPSNEKCRELINLDLTTTQGGDACPSDSQEAASQN